MENHYQEFDNIMEYYQEAKKYVLDNAEFFENKKHPWEIRIVYLTHSRDKEGNLVSFLEHGAKCDSKALSDDLARKNPGTDDYFTSWRLRNLSLDIFEIKGE